MVDVEKPAGETDFEASLLAELKPGASGAQPWTKTPTATSKAACSGRLFKTNSAS
jgi:hypothetical protein